METDAQFAHPSLADIPEGELVERFVADPYWRWLLFGIEGVPRAPVIRQRVNLAGVPGGDFKGDVDVLLCDPARPGEAVAHEVKRIKFGARAIRNGWPNKLHEYEEAVRQANLLAQIGFSQVYLHVLVVVDSREQNLGTISYAGISTKLKSVVNSHLSTAGLESRVGLYELEFVQPADHAPLT